MDNTALIILIVIVILLLLIGLAVFMHYKRKGGLFNPYTGPTGYTNASWIGR